MSIRITGLGNAFPANHVTNDDLAKKIETSDEWIQSHTGIKSRYYISEGESSATLSTAAAKKALAAAKIQASDLDAVICSTITPQFRSVPSNACLVQNALGCNGIPAFDIAAACSGFVYGLDISVAMMERHNWKKVLMCSGETLSQITDWNDRSSCILFGDAAGAVVLEETDSQIPGISSVILGADGSGGKDLYCEFGGGLQMDGHAVYNFAVKTMTEVLKKITELEQISFDSVDYIVCHQANKRILQAASKRLGVPFDKFICTLETCGNTSSASIPAALADLAADGKLKSGTLVLTAGFGAGLTWGGCAIRF